jgi:hypothetical protein
VKYGHVVTVRQSSGRSGVYMKERKKEKTMENDNRCGS